VIVDNIKSAINQLGLFKFITCDGNTYLFRDIEDPRQMANFIRITLDESNKELVIHGFGISNKHKGIGKQVIDVILNQLDNSWLVKLENNLNPDFWQHLNQKYYPNFTFISI
jgi:hypothetical protein